MLFVSWYQFVNFDLQKKNCSPEYDNIFDNAIMLGVNTWDQNANILIIISDIHVCIIKCRAHVDIKNITTKSRYMYIIIEGKSLRLDRAYLKKMITLLLVSSPNIEEKKPNVSIFVRMAQISLLK